MSVSANEQSFHDLLPTQSNAKDSYQEGTVRRVTNDDMSGDVLGNATTTAAVGAGTLSDESAGVMRPMYEAVQTTGQCNVHNFN